jgi:hypothetical protein
MNSFLSLASIGISSMFMSRFLKNHWKYLHIGRGEALWKLIVENGISIHAKRGALADNPFF